MPHQDATEKFYREAWPHMGVVLRTAGFLTRNAAEAEDLAQETMLKAFRFIDSLQEGTDAKGWLMAILRNTGIDRLRAAGKSMGDVSLEEMEVDVEDRSAGDVTPLPEEAWADPEQVLNGFSDEVMIRALKRLPEEIRWTLLLVDVEGVDQGKAAEIMDVPVGTVKSRAHRGRGMMKELLTQGQGVGKGDVR